MEVFKTKRPLSVQEQTQQLVAAQTERQINRQLMEQKRLLEAQETEHQKEMVAREKEQQEKEQQEKDLQKMANKKKEVDAKQALAESMSRLPAQAKKAVLDHVLFRIVNESLWIDPVIKENLKVKEEAMQLMESWLTTCNEATGTSYEKNLGNTKFLSCMKDVVEETAAKVVQRILTEAEELKSVKIDFHLSEEEERKLDEKMDGLGAKELSKAIKDKVLDTVKEEKEAGKVKSELFDALEKETEDDPEEGEGSSEGEDGNNAAVDDMVDESVAVCIETSSVYVGETETVLEDVSKRAKFLMQVADAKTLHGNLEDASGCYEEAFRLLTEAERVQFRPQEKSAIPSVMQFLAEAYASVQFDIKPVTRRAVRRVSKIPSTIENPLSLLENYCYNMANACRQNNVQYETIEEMQTRLIKKGLQRKMNNSIGNTLFENLMVRNTIALRRENPVLENGTHMLKDEIQSGAMLQTILEYTILETFHTMNLYQFDHQSIGKLKTT